MLPGRATVVLFGMSALRARDWLHFLPDLELLGGAFCALCAHGMGDCMLEPSSFELAILVKLNMR